MKQNKKMVNYFKKWEGMGAFGIGLLGVGALITWLQISFTLHVISMFLIAIGAVAFLYGNIGRGTESQITDSIAQNIESIRFPELEEDPKLRKRTPKEPQELTFEAFEMRNGLYFKKKKDASVISSEYTYIKMVVLSDAFYLKKRTFSFITDEKINETLDIPFDSIKDIEIIRNTLMVGHGDKPQHRVKTCHIAITYGDGQQILLPKKDDVYIDDFVLELKKKCGK